MPEREQKQPDLPRLKRALDDWAAEVHQLQAENDGLMSALDYAMGELARLGRPDCAQHAARLAASKRTTQRELGN